MLRLCLWILCFELGTGLKEVVGCVALMMVLGAPFAMTIVGRRLELDVDSALTGRVKSKEIKVDPIVTNRILEIYGVSLATLAKAAIYKGLDYKPRV